MKRLMGIIVVLFFIASLPSCSVYNKLRGYVGIGDFKRVANLISMDFGKGPDGPFQVSTIASVDPKLVVKNSTDRTITVKAQGPTDKTFVINSGQQSEGTVKSGKYHFVASAPGVSSAEGDVELKGFKQYKWEFIIRKQ